MSNTQKVREALLGGKSLCVDELVKLTGLPVKRVNTAIHELMKRGRAESFPVSYCLTERGEESHRDEPKRAAVPIKKVKPAKPVKVAAVKECPRAKQLAAAAEREVRGALTRRHSLDQFFGGCA